MFRNVPQCSGMFHVPDFMDARCEGVNGFHNVTFGPDDKAITSRSVFFWDSWFQPLKAFSAFGSFPPLVGHFFKRARERKVKLSHVVYEVWLVGYLFCSCQIRYFRKWIITSIGKRKHMRVTRFNPLWVSAGTESGLTFLLETSTDRSVSEAQLCIHVLWCHFFLINR